MFGLFEKNGGGKPSCQKKKKQRKKKAEKLDLEAKAKKIARVNPTS